MSFDRPLVSPLSNTATESFGGSQYRKVAAYLHYLCLYLNIMFSLLICRKKKLYSVPVRAILHFIFIIECGPLATGP